MGLGLGLGLGSHSDPASNANIALRERIMSQLHEELPGLDPFLNKYIRQFMIPDAERFLRRIRCPNVFARACCAAQAPAGGAEHSELCSAPVSPSADAEILPMRVYYCSTITKLFARGGGKQWRTCATRDYELRRVWTSLPITH